MESNIIYSIAECMYLIHTRSVGRSGYPIPCSFRHSPSFRTQFKTCSKCFTLADGKALVSMLTTMLLVRQYMSRREPCSMTQQMK